MLPSELKDKFERDGFVVLPNFISENEAEELNNECKKLVDNMDLAEHRSVFSSKHAYLMKADDYFLNSGDKIRFFFEHDAIDDDGSIKCDKYQALNKIGHALHWLNPVFKKITFSSKVMDILKCLGMVDPVVIHSMYIFKSANIGGEVIPHQDASYLYCEPEDNIIGLWIALEDATEDNGCLWFIPGSHSSSVSSSAFNPLEAPVQRRMIRNYERESGNFSLMFTGPQATYDQTKFVPVPVRKGDLILIHAKVVHKSEANKSNKPRPCYTFHIMNNLQTKFDKLNWIQPTKQLPFTPLYAEDS